MKKENSKTNEPHKSFLNLSQRLDVQGSNEHVALQNVSIYYPWKNMRQQYKKIKLKVIAPTWDNEFGLPDGSYSVSDIPDYIKYIIKNPAINFYINRINTRLVFKIKDGYKLEL